MIFPSIHLLGVLLAAAVNILFGMAWYSPSLFGKQWKKLSGIDVKKLAKVNKSHMRETYFALTVSSLIMSYVLALAIYFTQATTILTGAIVGALIWLGFLATTMLGGVLWEKKSLELYLINTGHYLVALVCMGALLALFA